MIELEKLCTMVDRATDAQRKDMIDESMARLVPVLKSFSLAYDDIFTVFASFMITAAYADGKIDEREYRLIHPIIQGIFGDYIDFNTAKEVVDEYAADNDSLKRNARKIINMLGQNSRQAQIDAVTVCLGVCAIDNDISAKEKAFLSELLA